MRIVLLLTALLLSFTGWGQAAEPALPPSRLWHDVREAPCRWRGRVGTAPITLTLDTGRTGYSGTYCYDRRGASLYLEARPGNTTGLVLRESTEYLNSTTTTGYFRFPGRPGPQLAGTWRSADGRRTLPVVLREDYTDAAQYQEESWDLTRFAHDPDREDARVDSAELHQHYLRLCLPGHPAAEQRLRRALGPPAPAARMKAYLDSVLRPRQETDSDCFFYGDQYVVYNSNYLFSVLREDRFSSTANDSYGEREWAQGRTYSLRTGQRLRLAHLLLPGYEPQLRRWLRQRLQQRLKDNRYDDDVGDSGKLPAAGFTVTATGLTFYYDDRDGSDLAYPGPYHADRIIDIELPYETLLPIVRPEGPLRELLHERRLLPRPR